MSNATRQALLEVAKILHEAGWDVEPEKNGVATPCPAEPPPRADVHTLLSDIGDQVIRGEIPLHQSILELRNRGHSNLEIKQFLKTVVAQTCKLLTENSAAPSASQRQARVIEAAMEEYDKTMAST